MAGTEVGLAKAGLDVFFALLGIPPPITIGSYNKQVKAVQKVCSCGFRYFAFLSISFVKFRKLKELIIKIKGSTHQATYMGTLYEKCKLCNLYSKHNIFF